MKATARITRCSLFGMKMLIVSFLLGSGFGLETASAFERKKPKPRPESVKKWYLRIQKTAARFEKGPTKAENDLNRDQLIKEISKEFDGSLFSYKTKVKEIRWKEGIAEVLTEWELPFAGRPSQTKPLLISRHVPIEILLAQEEAVAIRPGDWLFLTAKLKFHPRKWGAVGKETKSQQLFALQHKYIAGGYLGTFTTTEYECEIDGRMMIGRWTKAMSETGPEESN